MAEEVASTSAELIILGARRGRKEPPCPVECGLRAGLYRPPRILAKHPLVPSPKGQQRRARLFSVCPERAPQPVLPTQG